MVQKKIFNSVLSQVLYIFVSGFVGLALVPMTIDMLGKLDYGIFELVLSLVIIDAFLEFGLGSTLVKYVPEYKHDKLKVQTLFWSYFYIKLLLAFISLCLIIIIGYNFDTIFNVSESTNMEEIRYIVYLFGVGLIINSAVSFLDNLLRGFVYFGIANSVKILVLLLFISIYYLYYINSTSYSFVEIAFLWFIIRPLIGLIGFVGTLYFVNLEYILKPVPFKIIVIKNTLYYMYGMTYIVMVAQLLNRLPKILLGILATPITVAYWGIMEKIREPLLQLNSSMMRPFIPILSEKKMLDKLTEKKILQAIRIQYLFTSFLGIMVILHIDSLVRIWLGIEFSEVSKIVKTMILPFLLPSPGIFLMIYYAEGKTKINSIFTTINMFISLCLGGIVLFITNNLIFFSLSLSMVSIVINLMSLAVYAKYYDIDIKNILLKSIPLPFIIMSIYYFIMSETSIVLYQDIMNLCISIFLSFLLYIGLFFIFFKQEDKEILEKILKRSP